MNLNYYENYSGLTVEEYVHKYIRSSPKEMNRIIETIDLVPNDVENVLDIGAGHGIFLEELDKIKKVQGIGIEITDQKIEYAKSIGLDMRKGDASELNFPDNYFDLVVACEVVEHLPYGVYEKAIAEIIRVSRKYILVSVPFEENRVFIKCPYCKSTFNPSGHFRSFSDHDMTKLFSPARLEKTKKIGLFYQYPLQFFLKKIRFQKIFPTFSVCPVCAYTRNDHSLFNDSSLRTQQSLFTKNIIKQILKKIIKRKKAAWIACLYCINSN